ncbi:MAG: hypothetical protein IPM56_06745 [Ignavibacteriales bacterium]|nr:MAG: hypothetical protein IPM56_06745 [Ignavibacteriales bacterium]
MKKFLFIVITFIVSLLSGGCEDSITDNDIDNRIIPDSLVSFSQHLQPVFEIKCVSCHDDNTKAGGLSLTTWAGTTADGRVVVPFTPDNSVIVWTVEGRAGITPMPPLNSPYKPFTQNQVNGLKKWIEEGAQNN